MPVVFAKDAALHDGRGETTTSSPLDGREDFDFFAGCWTVTHRRLIDRLVGDTRWEEFGGACESRPILGGLGNVDDSIVELPAGAYRGATLRVFNPATRLWSIWWIDGRAAHLDPPVHGRFENGVGSFLGDDVLDGGRPILVRFVWSEMTSRSARWEQAFSPDGGATWECNWTMRFGRTA